MERLRRYFLLGFTLLGIVAMPANALAVGLYCNANGTIGLDGQGHVSRLYNADPYNNTGACQYSGLNHVFSYTVCKFVVVINEIMGRVYCGVQYSMIYVLQILLSIYVAVFGAQILMGTAELRPAEVVTRLVKMTLIWLFVTETTWGIGIAFGFFVGLLDEGTQWVLYPILGTNGAMPLYAYLDDLVFEAVLGPFSDSTNTNINFNFKLVGFFMLAWYVLPVVGIMILFWVWTTLSMLARSLITFLLGIASIAFLICLSPIFLCFMLFKATYYFFENWIRYMISYTLQVLITFALLSMWISISQIFIGFFDQLSDMIFPFSSVFVPGPSYQPTDTWGVCPLNRMNFYWDNSGNMAGPMAECIGTYGTNFYDQDLVPPSQLYQAVGLIYFIVYHLTTLIILAYAFASLIKDAPSIAKNLAGPAYIPPLGNYGWSAPNLNKQGKEGVSGNFTSRHSGSSTSGSSVFSQTGQAISKAVGGVVQNVHKQVSNRPKVGP